LTGFATTGLAGVGVMGWAVGIATGGGSDLDSGAGGAGTTRVFMVLTEEDSFLRLQAVATSDKASQCDSNTATSNANNVRNRIGKLERVGALTMLQYTASALPRLAD
jgi:hypothetical protein